MDFDSFSMIDAIAEIDVVCRTIVCTSKVEGAATLFAAHFPGMPLLPGVLQIEMMAQAAGLLIQRASPGDRIAIVTSMKHVRLRRPVRPGADLRIHASLAEESDLLAAATAEIRENGELRSEAKLRFVLMKYPNETLREWHRNRPVPVLTPVASGL